MAESTYLGACKLHVHCENYTLKEGEPIKFFGCDEIYDEAEWVDMKNCSGIIHPTTFSLVPNTNYVSMDKCCIEKCSPRTLASLEKLSSLDIRNSKFPIDDDTFQDCKNINSLSLADLEFTDASNKWSHLSSIDTISFSTCKFESLSKNFLRGLNSIKYLSISDCKIGKVSADCFDELLNLEGLDIRDCEIGEIDCSSFSKLSNLTRLSFHHLTTPSEICYDLFSQLPKLEIILFDNDVYKSLNFDDFPSLKTVEIGYSDEQPNTGEDEILEKLRSKDIGYQYVFCGKIEVDMNEMQICC